MRWTGGRRSGNVEDRRGIPMSRGVAGGGIGLIVVVLLALFFGVDPSVLLQGGGPDVARAPVERGPQAPPADDPVRDFVSVVLADTEDTWKDLFRRMNRTYQEPRLVLFSGAVESACGFAQAAVGPFYCPADRKVYLDLSFFRDLHERFGAPGEFAQAYVIAHEIGHHVQTLLGISDEVMALRQRVGPAQEKALSVRQELQADCFAGVWARNAHDKRNILEEGDVEEGLNAAAAIGDDRMQRQSTGYVSPESFTHGSSAQRVRWFKRGLATGDPQQCDTFSAANP
ncbi:MAG TPA: neutral zinc metallopeptidase [Candidatus Binatia bacterium]|nr:neutral zinc metallopeptidase [Candidatus Binatia bacterium]